VILDSQAVLVAANVLGPGERPVSRHLGSDLEVHSILQGEGWVLGVILVDQPALVVMDVAFVPDDMSVVLVCTSINIEALFTDVSDGLDLLDVVVPIHFLQDVAVLVVSDDCMEAVAVEVTSYLDRNDFVFVSVGTNGVGPVIKEPPLSVVVRVVVLDSESVLALTDVLVPEECSSRLHLGLDLEGFVILDWESLELHLLLIKEPSLTWSSAAHVEDQVVVLVA